MAQISMKTVCRENTMDAKVDVEGVGADIFALLAQGTLKTLYWLKKDNISMEDALSTFIDVLKFGVDPNPIKTIEVDIRNFESEVYPQ